MINFLMPVLFVKDISKSKNFYQELFSFEIEYDFGENISFKDSISLWQRKRAKEIIFNSNGLDMTNQIEEKSVELYFEAPKIEEMWEQLKVKSLDLIHGLKEESWGQRTIRLYDPDKFIIEIAEPSREVVLRLSKEGRSKSEISKKTQLPTKVVEDLLDH